MIECIFGWGKQHGTLRRTKHRGLARVGTDFMFNLIAYNLIRITLISGLRPDMTKPCAGPQAPGSSFSRAISSAMSAGDPALGPS